MRRILLLSVILTGTLAAAAAEPQPASTPIVFEPNRGQASADVQWLARGPGFQLGITSDSAIVVLHDRPAATAPASLSKRAEGSDVPQIFLRPPISSPPKGAKPSVVKLRLAGSNAWKATGLKATGGISNYFIGNEPSKWHTDIPQYAQVKADGVYDGVDLIFYGDEQGSLEYDFVVAPGADPQQIQLAFEGATGHLDSNTGDLVLATPSRKLLHHKHPKIYQEIGGEKVSVKGGYEILGDGKAIFKLGDYDKKHPLVIDPQVSFTTFLAGAADEEGAAVAFDSLGNSYVTGYTYSNNFPTSGGVQGDADNEDAFVTKLSPTGGILFSTYLGGGDDDWGAGIAVDASGVYVTGGTASDDFPSKQSLQFFNNGDAFVTKLSLLGNALIYSSFVGGSSTEWAYAIAVDSTQSAYIGGITHSDDFPVVAGFEYFPGSQFVPIKGFVAKLSPNGATLVYSTYLGGTQGTPYDYVSSIAVDSSLSAYVTGYTCATDFPYAGYYSLPYPGTCSGFVTKLSPAGNSLIYSTYLVSNISNSAGLALDAAGNAYVAGTATTVGSEFSVEQVFVAKILPTGKLGYFRFFNGNEGSSWGQGIATDVSGNAWVVGATTSHSFPGAPPLTPNPYAGFVMKLDPSGNGPIYTVLLGAQINGAAVFKPKPRIPLPTYPLIYTTGYRFTGSSNRDAWVVKLDESPIIVNE
jgi:Beta-propeller repeat